MVNARNAVKGFFAMLFCGLAAINLFPNSDYAKPIPLNSASMMGSSWEMTGVAMQRAIDKAGGKIGRKR